MKPPRLKIHLLMIPLVSSERTLKILIPRYPYLISVSSCFYIDRKKRKKEKTKNVMSRIETRLGSVGTPLKKSLMILTVIQSDGPETGDT